MPEKKGYVIRVKDEKDKRNVFVVPTAKAKAWITETEEKYSITWREGCRC